MKIFKMAAAAFLVVAQCNGINLDVTSNNSLEEADAATVDMALMNLAEIETTPIVDSKQALALVEESVQLNPFEKIGGNLLT